MIFRKFRFKCFISWLIKILTFIVIVIWLNHLRLIYLDTSADHIIFEDMSRLLNTQPEKPKILSKCKMNIRYHPSHVLEMHDVILHPELAVGFRKGGEAIEDVKGQSEMKEYFSLKDGFLNVSCLGNSSLEGLFTKMKFRYRLQTSFISQIVNTTVTSNYTGNNIGYKDNIGGLTVGICRTDYASMYWTTIEVYSAYFTAREMNQSAKDTTILLVDAHPSSHLDGLWNLIFRKVLRVGWMNNTTHLDNFAFAPSLKFVPIVQNFKTIPYFNNFRDEVSLRAGVSLKRTINCQPFMVTLVLRKNYVAHPRNMVGTIPNQIANSEELIKALQNAFPKDTFRTAVLEMLSVKAQVKLITETDLLIGVHGAGLAHTLFQITGAGLIELFSHKNKRWNNPHYQQLAEWSGKHYSRWYSRSASDLLNVPPNVLIEKVLKMRREICKKI